MMGKEVSTPRRVLLIERTTSPGQLPGARVFTANPINEGPIFQGEGHVGNLASTQQRQTLTEMVRPGVIPHEEVGMYG